MIEVGTTSVEFQNMSLPRFNVFDVARRKQRFISVDVFDGIAVKVEVHHGVGRNQIVRHLADSSQARSS